jgi:hypothetical protein
LKAAFVCGLVGLIVGAACLVIGGPLPGDVALTRGLQAAFGAEPLWAEFLTSTAKVPLLWGALLVGAGLAALIGGWRAALATPVAYGLAWLADKGLRMVLFAPKPDPDLVAVASASSASGLP